MMELLMLLAISVGIVHISVSVMSRLASARISEEPLLYPASIIAILWPTVALSLARWEPMPPWSTTLAKYLLVGGLLSLVKAKGIEAFEELIALFANIVSYSRIAIIAVLHVVVARLLLEGVYGLPRTLTGAVVGIAAFASGAALILAMGVFITFIHSLRLHWLEFFKRFYSGMGESFKPFTRKSEYTYLH
ncbi:MAG: V-type ATPase 116kDa subunit family protein, partial [Candidatus Hydrothermarchaeaceae archaeon]